jgi:hypothetical protein
VSEPASRDEVTPAQAREEFVRRVRGTALHFQFIQLDIMRRLHAKQRAVVDMVFAFVRFIAAECSRRAGKTHLGAAVIILKLLYAKRGQEVVFVAPTLARGKELIWGELERMLDEYGLRPEDGWKRTAASGKLRTPAGAMFRIVGLDNKKQVGKIARGGNTILLITDETQEFPHLLEALLVAAGPALAQSRGCCLAMGTPTTNESDYWAKICDGEEGFQHVHWTLRDNPYLGRDPDELLAEERERHGWSEAHPTYVREYLGRRCRDASNMVLEIDEKRNVVKSIGGYDPRAWQIDLTGQLPPAFAAMRAQWRHFKGIDFGFGDKTAWVVLAAPLHASSVFVVHCEQEAGLTWDQVAERTKKLCERYTPAGVVGDSASGGKQFIETFNVRYGRAMGIAARPATKHDKKASIETMNTELRTGRLRFLCPPVAELVKEASALQWAAPKRAGDPERTEILSGSAYPEDLFDALRYAFNDFWAFAHPTREKRESEDDRRVRERNERESARQANVRQLHRR